MTQTNEAPAPGPGHNIRAIREDWQELNEQLPTYLENKYASLVRRSKILLEAMSRAPTKVTDDNASVVSDQVAQIKELTDEAEAAREALAKPVLKAQRTVNGFFATHFDVLSESDKKKPPGWKQKLEALLTVYQVAKVNAECQRREEEERKAREAAAEAQRIADEEARKAAEIKRKSEEEAAAAAAAIQNEEDLEKALALEAAERERVKQAEAEAALRAKDAESAAAAAAAALRSTQAKGAELYITRGDYGSSASLRSSWIAQIEDIAKIDLNKIRDFISRDEVQRALNAYGRAHKNTRPLDGVVFLEEKKSVVRG